MPSDPTTKPIYRPGLPAHPFHGGTPDTKPLTPKPPPGTPSDVPDSSTLEPVPHVYRSGESSSPRAARYADHDHRSPFATARRIMTGGIG
ncbi:hypothetical protein P3T23_009249 [Paraburkholderia sp. GAS448]